jgi:hypothetical protein
MRKSGMKDEKKKRNYTVPLIISGVVVIFLAMFGLQMNSEKSTNISGLPGGTPAPEFALTSTKGDISLAEFQGKKNVVLYFYEGNF